MYRSTLDYEFKHVSASQQDSYIASPLYYALTGRKGAWIYKKDGINLVVCQHPHKINTLLVFPENSQSETDYSLTASVLQKLYRSDHDIQLARYTSGDLQKLKLAFDMLDLNIVDGFDVVEENILDWKYPVHILDTNIISRVEGGKFRRLRQKCNELSKSIISKPFNQKTAIKDMRVALKYWEGSMINAGKETDDMLDFYHEFIKILDKFEGIFDGLICYQDRRPVGFSVWEVVSEDTANFFINIGDASIAGLADFQMVEVSKSLYAQGVKFLNVGGSETAKLDTYKRKFMPVKSIELQSAMVRYKDFGLGNGVTYSKFV